MRPETQQQARRMLNDLDFTPQAVAEMLEMVRSTQNKDMAQALLDYIGRARMLDMLTNPDKYRQAIADAMPTLDQASWEKLDAWWQLMENFDFNQDMTEAWAAWGKMPSGTGDGMLMLNDLFDDHLPDGAHNELIDLTRWRFQP